MWAGGLATLCVLVLLFLAVYLVLSFIVLILLKQAGPQHTLVIQLYIMHNSLHLYRLYRYHPKIMYNT